MFWTTITGFTPRAESCFVATPWFWRDDHARMRAAVAVGPSGTTGGKGCWARWNYGGQRLLGPMELKAFGCTSRRQETMGCSICTQLQGHPGY